MGPRTLDEWIDEERHAVDRCLTLFATICDAVNAAHLRGIIHRDLKPENIRIDEADTPCVVGFGLVPGGTPPWSSPEQAAGRPEEIDLRTDVYSLGVILFQMLTGWFPYDVRGDRPEVLYRIQHAEPQRPRLLRSGIDDDVETMVLKCLAKTPEERYQSAGEVARDIDRYRAGDPITAKPLSPAYVLRKMVSRWVIVPMLSSPPSRG